MTGPEHAAEPGSNSELPAEDEQSDEEIEQETHAVYDQISAPFGEGTAAVRETIERAATDALADADEMDRQVDADRAVARFEVANQYGELHLQPQAQQTVRKSAVSLTIGLVIGGLTIAATAVTTYMVTSQQVANTPPPGPDDPAEDAFEAEVRKLVDAWQQLPEAEYWAAMAQWVRDNNPSWYRQRYVATYAASIAKNESSGASLDVAERRLVAEWEQKKPDASQLYTLLATAQINGVVLTRKDKLDALVRAINEISPPSP